MSFSWCCLNVAIFLHSSHRNPVQRYKKYLRFTSVFQIILVTKARMHFLPLRLKVGPSLRTPSPCPTDQEFAHVGKRQTTNYYRSFNSQQNSPSLTGEGRGGAEGGTEGGVEGGVKVTPPSL